MLIRKPSIRSYIETKETIGVIVKKKVRYTFLVVYTAAGLIFRSFLLSLCATRLRCSILTTA